MSAADERIEERKQRWWDFLDPEAPPRHMLLVRRDEGLPPRPLPHPGNKQERIEWAWTRYQSQLEWMEWLDDDSLPNLDPYTGTEIFAAAFGCEVHRPDDSNPFALPMVHDASQVAGLSVPEITAEPLAMLFDIADELRRRAGDGALMRLPDIQSPMDIASLIWDKNSLYMALLEAPEAVKELAGKVRGVLTAFLDEWMARYGRDFIAHYPDYYMPGGITLSEDEIGVVNPEMFHELYLPELVELSERYGGIGVHCCADARHHWEGFKDIPHLRLLNLVHRPDEVRAAYEYFGDYVPHMHSWCGEGAPAEWVAGYPAQSRVVLQVSAASGDEARQMADELRPLCDPSEEQSEPPV